MHRWRWRLARSVAVLAAAAACWTAFVATQRVDDGRLAALVVRRPPFSQVRPEPVSARSLPASASTVSLVRRAAKTDPAHAGIYEIGWESPPSAKVTTNAGLLVQLLPSRADAARVLAGVRRQYSTRRAVGGDTYARTETFAVPGVPGARGAVYEISSSSTAGSGTADVVTFQVGTAAVLELLQTTGSTIGPSQAVALAQQERARLAKREPGLSLVVTHRPLGATVGLFGGAVVVAAGVAVVPEGVGRWRRRRRQRREEHAHRQALAEQRAVGRRAVKRHRAPAWQRRHARRRSARTGWWQWPGRRRRP